MAIHIINHLKHIPVRGGLLMALHAKAGLVAKWSTFLKRVKADKKEIGKSFSAIMMKVAIFKLVAAAITLAVMTVLFLAHLHSFAPITAQFSKWVSSPIIGFILLVIVLKFTALSLGICATILSVKEMTVLEGKIWIKATLKLKFKRLFRKKMTLKRASLTSA
ncbi:MAG: hypothetical protein GY941_28065 [Planctomycetes bacterium]|nr:hypothetical protein [Planctomycetota bacterium]